MCPRYRQYTNTYGRLRHTQPYALAKSVEVLASAGGKSAKRSSLGLTSGKCQTIYLIKDRLKSDLQSKNNLEEICVIKMISSKAIQRMKK